MCISPDISTLPQALGQIGLEPVDLGLESTTPKRDMFALLSEPSPDPEQDEKMASLDDDEFYDIVEDEEKKKMASMKKLILQDLAHLPNPLFHVSRSICERKVNRQELIDMLRKQRLHLPISLASHENRLLQEAGTWSWKSSHVVFQMPACEHGDNCIVRRSEIPGLSSSHHAIGPLMIYMTEQEWDQLPDRVPTDARPCLLCYRYYTTRFVINIKAHSSLQTRSTFCFQLFRNLVDEKDGYKRQHTLCPSSTHWLGFVNPIVRFERMSLMAYFDEENKRWRISQDAILASTSLPLDMVDKHTGTDASSHGSHEGKKSSQAPKLEQVT
jgi:hypothetical protein